MGGGHSNKIQSNKRCALILAVQELVWYYLTSGETHANVQDNQGLTPLHLSCGRGLVHISRMLLHHGAHPNAKSADGTR